ncbi:UDP-2,4-diacetamido-2,4,6-trideoxy-beta-L-altropyranose hydrolase [Microvirga sp. STR05]|uniref:UDP-2,4-diacetamido-2,4, 6-trideoxy-beta-L-altropyranose hydrolase n=1 Tax=Hymenobacter duratus TaxID=2771356 RepID=A0ABR8JDT6_9BACT|nr:UDP-2,4-diacetamido-2,4,6-trideoxy-beta-L-altropyranose hydrolase [Hymenobacter duratus]MBD2715011.1 UDP-2,4-diacetamido-2,4,6-trideoxy-beta-L-altropyranose hydrolase [Hymenobacter duratus]MBR7949917.1 UDP-2,4-diacetamido-2,4,6-trideoxy-beta-L-altropyranose hydrolase [Microvirga sp. STR05]
MPLPRLLLRADGNSHIGLGHVMRLLALAEILRDEAAECLFLVREPSPELQVQLTEAGCAVLTVPVQPLAEEAAWLVRHILLATDVLVLDGYAFTYSYQNTVRGAVARLVYLDDLHSFPLAADVVLNPAGGLSLTHYDLRQPGARLLVGPAYAPLRSAFRQASSWPASTALPDTVMVCLGGADPTHQTRHVAAALLALPSVAQVHAVLGSAYSGWDELHSWATQQPRLTLHRSLSAAELVELMRRCGAAVCSPSTVSYEYCAAGGGLLLLLPVADNQHDINQYLRATGLALPYPSAPNVLTSAEAGRLAAQLRLRQRQVFDGLAPVRLRQEFRAMQLLAPPFHLRPVRPTDSAQLLAWTNDPTVRQHSFNPNPVPQPAHEQWFAARLEDPNSLLLVAEDAASGQPVGLIRFQAEGTEATLSYLLDAAYRGRGLAPLLLLAGTRMAVHFFARVRQIVGHVQTANVASVKAFERAGYHQSAKPLTPAPDSVSFVWEAAEV